MTMARIAYADDLVQDNSVSITIATQILQSCTKPSTYQKYNEQNSPDDIGIYSWLSKNSFEDSEIVLYINKWIWSWPDDYTAMEVVVLVLTLIKTQLWEQWTVKVQNKLK